MCEVSSELGRAVEQQGFVVGVCCRRRPVEGSSDHFELVDHGELVVQLVAVGEAWSADTKLLLWF